METHKIGNYVRLTSGIEGHIIAVGINIGNRVTYTVVVPTSKKCTAFEQIACDHASIEQVAMGKKDAFGNLPDADFLNMSLGDEVIDKLTERVGIITSQEVNHFGARVVGVTFFDEEELEFYEGHLPVNQIAFYGEGILKAVEENRKRLGHEDALLKPGDPVKSIIGGVVGVVEAISYLDNGVYFRYVNKEGNLISQSTYECTLEKIENSHE